MKNLKLNRKAISLLSVLSLAVFVAIGVSACNLCNPAEPPEPDNRIKTETTFELETSNLAARKNEKTKEFTYDSLNRLIRIKEGTDITTYTFTPTQVKSSKLSNPFILNSAGYITSDNQGFYSYVYDSEGHRIKDEPNVLGFATIEYTWTNGNLTQKKITEPNGSVRTYTYDYLSIERKWVDGMDWFYGKRSKNKVVHEFFSGQIGTGYIYNTRDSRGRDNEWAINKYGLNGNIQVITYTYFN